MSLLMELKRRKVVRVAAVYALTLAIEGRRADAEADLGRSRIPWQPTPGRRSKPCTGR